jgi:hypothetical protein
LFPELSEPKRRKKKEMPTPAPSMMASKKPEAPEPAVATVVQPTTMSVSTRIPIWTGSIASMVPPSKPLFNSIASVISGSYTLFTLGSQLLLKTRMVDLSRVVTSVAGKKRSKKFEVTLFQFSPKEEEDKEGYATKLEEMHQKNDAHVFTEPADDSTFYILPLKREDEIQSLKELFDEGMYTAPRSADFLLGIYCRSLETSFSLPSSSGQESGKETSKLNLKKGQSSKEEKGKEPTTNKRKKGKKKSPSSRVTESSSELLLTVRCLFYSLLNSVYFCILFLFIIVFFFICRGTY